MSPNGTHKTFNVSNWHYAGVIRHTTHTDTDRNNKVSHANNRTAKQIAANFTTVGD